MIGKYNYIYSNHRHSKRMRKYFCAQAAISVTGEDPGWSIDFEGAIIVPPQSYVCIAAVGGAVAAAGMNAGIMWAEVAF